MRDVTARVCISVQSERMDFKRQNASILEAGEICRRTVKTLDEGNYEIFPDEQEKKVCIAFNIETEEVQVSITGLSPLDASAIASLGQFYFQSLVLGTIVEN